MSKGLGGAGGNWFTTQESQTFFHSGGALPQTGGLPAHVELGAPSS